ncbi:hypothetical protein [Corynebacterium phocae]|uniref:hypothetical protein n=1 Tax=Corynebacterium phocae TaxID=161895 RepID=UPI00095152F7|nr:hypothetical protein [Corynebacterium phocae]KAA8721579.1 hypothetical protein F4V58_10020 [Corynebacterium phocae]
MKNFTSLGVLAGLILAWVVITGCWELAVLCVVFATVGGLIGAHFDGRINLKEIGTNLVGKGQG